jgi:hypothetical protein
VGVVSGQEAERAKRTLKSFSNVVRQEQRIGDTLGKSHLGLIKILSADHHQAAQGLTVAYDGLRCLGIHDTG